MPDFRFLEEHRDLLIGDAVNFQWGYHINYSKEPFRYVFNKMPITILFFDEDIEMNFKRSKTYQEFEQEII